MGELTQETKDQIRQLLLDPESLDAVTDFYAICGQNLVRDTAEFNVAVSRAVELFHTMNCLHRAFAWAKLVCYREILIEMHPKIAKTMVATLMCDEATTHERANWLGRNLVGAFYEFYRTSEYENDPAYTVLRHSPPA